jgi:hypothetical protein
MRVALVAAAVAGSLLFGEQAEGGKLLGRETMIGSWHAGAYADDQSHRFSFCSAFANYDGVRVSFMIDSGYQWAVGFSSQSFSFKKGEAVRVGLALDDSAEEIVEGRVVDPALIRITLAPKSDLFRRFMRANVMRLVALDQSYRFDLEDPSELLPFLLKCVHDRLNTPPFQTHGQPAHPTPGSAAQSGTLDLRAEVTSLAANLLSEAGVRGFKIAPNAENLNSVVWTSPGGNGALAVELDPNLKRPSDFTPRLIGWAASKCKGQFISGAMPEENGAARAFSSCQIGTGEPLSGYYVTLPRGRGGHYVLMVWPRESLASQSNGQEPDKDVRNAAYRVLR